MQLEFPVNSLLNGAIQWRSELKCATVGSEIYLITKIDKYSEPTDSQPYIYMGDLNGQSFFILKEILDEKKLQEFIQQKEVANEEVV